MCLILMAFHVNARYPLVVAANRDEFYDRPSLPAGYWPENPSILAGKDLRGGGAWFGVTKEGRFAAITNFRDPLTKREGQRSRGLIVADYLTGSRAPDAFVKDLRRRLNQYNDFTVILGSAESLFSYSNRDDVLKEVTRGFHGLSNHFIDTPWPKVTKGLAK
ncbi:MAG: NRDE family protein, partial [Deltaproteobacteria bacterium]|nr:NRDE family protein [Deltaproteobacteria bacterium]